MKIRTKDKVYSLLWNIDKYIKQVKKHDEVNGIPRKHIDLIKANKHRLYVDRLYKDIKRIGWAKYRISRDEMLELNNLYKQYRINLDIHPQYTPPSVSSRLRDI
jgi:hypothetical protein